MVSTLHMTRIYPRSFTTGIPEYLKPADAPPSAVESAEAERIRGRFLFKGEKQPWMVDMIRAMRLARGLKRYVEIGTYDKGCLAYASTLLHPEALLVDVDIEARQDKTREIKAFLQPGQRLATVVGDSAEAATVEKIREALGGELADLIFIDGNHMAAYVWADFAHAQELLAPQGLILFHDIYWRGADNVPGASEAMAWIDRVTPVHAISGADPIHRYFPDLIHSDPVWGGVGIVRP